MALTKPNEDTEPRVQLLFVGSWPKGYGAVRLVLARGFVFSAPVERSNMFGILAVLITISPLAGIVFFVIGVVILIKKQIKISANRILTGKAAKNLGALFLVPLILSFGSNGSTGTAGIVFGTMSVGFSLVATAATIYIIFFSKERGSADYNLSTTESKRVSKPVFDAKKFKEQADRTTKGLIENLNRNLANSESIMNKAKSKFRFRLKFYWSIIPIGILILGAFFYWYSYRPYKLRQECLWTKAHVDAVVYKPAEGSLEAQNACQQACDPQADFGTRLNCNLQCEELYTPEQPAQPAKDWWVKTSKQAYEICLKNKGL